MVRNIRTSMERYFRLAEIKDAKVNDLRHTFVAHHLKQGASLVLISKILGHKRLSTTERYLKAMGSDVANTAIRNQPMPSEEAMQWSKL